MLSIFFDQINSCHPNIEFTMEEALDGKLNFLDTSVNNNESLIDISCFNKKTNIGLYTHHSSLVDFELEKALISSLLSRAYGICTSWKNFHDQIDYIKNCLMKLGYSENFIYNCISKYLCKIFDSDTKSVS